MAYSTGLGCSATTICDNMALDRSKRIAEYSSSKLAVNAGRQSYGIMSMAFRDIRIEDEPENENSKSMSNPTLLRIQGSQDCPLTNRSLHMVSMKDTSVLLPSIQSMGSDGHVKVRDPERSCYPRGSY